MTRDPICINPEMTMADAATLMLQKKVPPRRNTQHVPRTGAFLLLFESPTLILTANRGA
jgi:CBS domain-containing protein